MKKGSAGKPTVQEYFRRVNTETIRCPIMFCFARSLGDGARNFAAVKPKIKGLYLKIKGLYPKIKGLNPKIKELYPKIKELYGPASPPPVSV